MEVKRRLRGLTIVVLTLVCTSAALAQTEDTTARVNFDAPMIDYTVPKQYILRDVKFSGVKNLLPEIMINKAGISRGDTIMIPGEYLSSAARKLMDMNLLSDVQMFIYPAGNEVDLEIYMQELPRVFKWDITGVFKAEKKELLEEKLKLQKGAQLSKFVLETSKEAIRKFLKEKGYLNAEINIVQSVDTAYKNAVNVTFDVTKNSRVRIKEINFEGNEAISDKKLRKSFKKTHKVGINFFRNTKLKEKEYLADKDNLVDYYQSKGYRNAIVLSDSIYTINPKRIGITINVDEGDKFYFRDIKWTGNSIYRTSLLNDTMLMIRKGDVYDKQTMHKRLGVGREVDPEAMSVWSEYQNSGYIFSSIEPVETVVGKDSVDVEIKIFEGNPARVNNVDFVGNYKVDDAVIRRELYIRPGELYNRAMVMQTIRQLSQMEHFNPEAIAPDIKPVSNDLVDISISLEEQASDKFEVSGGLGAGMFVGSVGVQLNNISLKRMFKKDAWRPFPQGQSQSLTIRGQTNGSYYKALSLNFMEPWLGGKKPNSLNVGVYYSDQNDAYYFTQKSDKYFRTLGASAGLGHRLSWPDRYFTIYNEISYQAYMLKDWDNFVVTNGTSNIIQFKTVFGRNSVDQPVYPRSGSDFSISLALTPPYSLFDGKDYASSTLTQKQRYGLIEFNKWSLKAQWFYAISKNNKLVLMAKAEMGYLGAYNKNKVSPFEGFEVGGDGMSGYNVYGVDIISLRGYENGALTSQNYDSETMGREYSRGYNKYTVELRYPLVLQPRSTIYGLLFAEAGNAFNSWQSFDPFNLKRSLGFGVRLHLPMLGMVGFDWGYGFDKAVGKTTRSGGQPHFVIGYQF